MAFNKYQYDKLRAKRHANKIKHKQEIYEIRHSNDPERKKPQFSKIAVAFIFVDTLVIQIYCMFAMWHFKDMSNLNALIGIFGALLTQCLSYWTYSKKATVENTVGGIVYQNMMNSLEQNNMENDISEDITDDGAVG